MPTPTLSERLLKLQQVLDGETKDEADFECLREAARLLAPYEQPEVAELLDRVEALKHTGQLRWAADLRDHARALVALAEARAKVKRVEGLLQEWWDDADAQEGLGEPSPGQGYANGLNRAADEVEAALSGTGEKAEFLSGAALSGGR